MMQSFLAVVRYAVLAAAIADVSRHLGLPLSFAQAFGLVAIAIVLHMEGVQSAAETDLAAKPKRDGEYAITFTITPKQGLVTVEKKP